MKPITDTVMKEEQPSLFSPDQEGRGVAELSPEKTREPRSKPRPQQDGFALVECADIIVPADHPRKHLDQENVNALADSIRNHGMLQPILCRRFEVGDNDTYVVVAGKSRVNAAIQVGLEKIPIMVTAGDPLEISLIENLFRQNLTAVEEAEALLTYKENMSASLQQLAGTFSRAVSTISEILAAAKLPVSIRDECRNNPAIPRDVLVKISRISGQDAQIKAFQKYILSNSRDIPIKEKKGRRLTIPVRLVKSMNHNLGKIEVKDLSENDREKLHIELNKLQQMIANLLELLK